MAIEIPKAGYTGTIKEIPLGDPAKGIKAGGDAAYPFHLFEGAMPNAPKIAMDVLDAAPDDWPKALTDVYGDVLGDPVAWAKKNVEEFGADMIDLELVSIDPNGMNRGAAEAVAVVKSVVDAIDVPVIIWGCSDADKDSEVLRAIMEACEGKNLILGPVEEANHKKLGAAAIGFKHSIIASSPIDINLAKQLNILLGNLGVPDSQILIDPTTGGLGYGLEYSYSVMERARMAALTQEDEKLQFPMVCNIGKEVWKTREAKLPTEDAPELGKALERGVLMESVTAVSLLQAGAGIVILRHPDTVKLVRKFIGELTEG